MKHWLIIVLLSIGIHSLNAQDAKGSTSDSSGSGKFGLGLSLFGPFGITGKYQKDEKLSFEGSLGFGGFGNGRFHLHGVALYNFYSFNESLSLYGGGGLVIEDRYYHGNGDGYNEGEGKGKGRWKYYRGDEGYENSFGIRAPIGISWKNQDKKFELSAEVYANLFLVGRDGFNLGLALAARYYF